MKDKFSNFLRTFGATKMLLQKAHKQGFLIEGAALYASLIDGLCRICLVLKEQIEKNSNDVNEKYIYQREGERNFSEREIYRMVFSKKIINKNLFFISEIEYSHLEVVCNHYERVYNQLLKINYSLESEQINRGVGMTKNKKVTDRDKANIHNLIARKIRSGDERNLAKTLGCVSVEEIIEFASKNKLTEKCLCGHEKIYHLNLDILNKNQLHNLEDGLSKCSSNNCSCSNYKKINSVNRCGVKIILLVKRFVHRPAFGAKVQFFDILLFPGRDS